MDIQSLLRPNNTQLLLPKCSRLLYVVGQLRLGGLERQLYYLLANLDHAQYRPAVVVWNINPNDKYYWDIRKLEVPICGFPAEWSPWSKLRALAALAREVEPEVIHSYGFHTNFAAAYAAWQAGALAIGSLRGDFARAKAEGGPFRGALNAKWPACHISNSMKSADAANGATGPFRPNRIFVVRNALDVKQFELASDAPKRQNYVAAVGSLSPVKRWDRLLRVVGEVKAVAYEDVRFQIAGDGPLRSTLEKTASDLGVSGCVEFRGPVHDIPAFLNGARFLVHTSESEGYPNAVMEAMACGLPVVAMDTGDIPWLVEDGKTGFVVPQGDEGTFVRRISQLLGDEGLCLSMGAAAREKAKREFTLERLVCETLDAYRVAGWRDGMVDGRSMTSGEIGTVNSTSGILT